MSEFRIASSYAKSLLTLADEQKCLDEVMDDMQGFATLAHQNHDLVMMLQNPIINAPTKFKILKKIFEGKVHALTLSIFEIITRKGREQFLPQIVSAFKAQYYEFRGFVESSITTVVPVDADTKKEIDSIVKSITGKKVILNEWIDPELIGGFVLKIGDRQIDDSVSGKLRDLKLKFIQNQYVSKV